jgi:hypothetical protein
MLEVSNDYIGKIVNAELQERDGKLSAVIIVRPDGSPHTARWFGSFSETVIGGQGRNAGKIVGEVTAATLGEFGLTDFGKIESLIGQPVAFGVKHNPGENGKIWVECNFIRPPRPKNPATSAGLASINRFRGAAIEAARKVPKPSAPAGGSQQSRGREPGDDDAPYDDDMFR